MMRLNQYKHLALAVLLLLSTAWTLPSGDKSNLPLPSASALESISEADLLQHAEFLASDELGGRYAFGSSNQIAARYLASQLRRFGYRGGGGDGLFFQKFEVTTEQFDPAATFLEAGERDRDKRFVFGDDFVVMTPYVYVDITAPLVLVPLGFGQAGQTQGEQPLDLRGKIAVVPTSYGSLSSSGARGPVRRSALSGGRMGLIRNIVNTATQKGAVGVILIIEGETASPRFPESLRTSSTYGGTLKFATKEEQKRLPIIHAYDPLIQWMFDGTGISVESLFSSEEAASPRDLKNLKKTLRINASNQGPRYETQNVIGILDGSDPKLKNEYIMFSAHYDHLQTTGETIYNGADDDGSGTSAVLEIAQAFAVGPRPRRSILIIFHTAEEENLMGSTYFVQHPTLPLSSIVVDLNIDMIGRTRKPGDTNPANLELSDANSLYLIGSDALSAELHRLSEQTNEDTVRMNLDYRYSNPEHPYKLYYRSDHWNYAKNGIPVIFYFTGLHEDYHRPTDDVDKLDFKKMARITRFIFATGWRIANLDHRLKLDNESKP
jgi:hypothetical protein